jgi:hypothetical protein
MKALYVMEVFRSGTQRAGRRAPYRWRLRSRRNGQIVATAGESFASKQGAVRAGKRLLAGLLQGRVTIEVR